MTQDLENLVNRSYTSEPKYTEIMTGVPEDYKQIRTLGDLLEVNYKIITAKEQLRQNLISKITGYAPVVNLPSCNTDRRATCFLVSSTGNSSIQKRPCLACMS